MVVPRGVPRHLAGHDNGAVVGVRPRPALHLVVVAHVDAVEDVFQRARRSSTSFAAGVLPVALAARLNASKLLFEHDIRFLKAFSVLANFRTVSS